jgi:hypothetical protein
MTRAILGVAALLGAAIALAGCGGGGSASGTTGGVAGARTAKGSGSFHAKVSGFETRIQTSVHAFANGNISKAVSSGGSLLADCHTTVNNKIAPDATTRAQKQSVRDLRKSCTYMDNAVSAGENGNMSAAQSWAKKALTQAKLAVQTTG